MKFFKPLIVSLTLALIAVNVLAAPQSKGKNAAHKRVTVTLVRWPYT
jgi:hypothetical protein